MSDHKRSMKRVLISLTEADLSTLDNLGAAVVEPGLPPNRSAAVRYLIDQSRTRPCPSYSPKKIRKGA